MRGVLLAIAALSLSGCDHMYGGMDAGRLTLRQGAAPSEADLIAIAAKKIEGQGRSLADMTGTVTDTGNAWRVRFGPSDPQVLDGGVTVEISKKTLRAGRLWDDA
jgi:hypothetical protein